jgi:hypothetical protein
LACDKRLGVRQKELAKQGRAVDLAIIPYYLVITIAIEIAKYAELARYCKLQRTPA